MLSKFDWLRRARSGAELLATLQFFAAKPHLHLTDMDELGAPFSALDGPCERCHIFPRWQSRSPKETYCRFCRTILSRAQAVTHTARHAAVIWGFVQELPKQFRHNEGLLHKSVVGSYVHDDNRFVAMIRGRELRPWLQELVLYHGADLLGVLQVFPTVSGKTQLTIGAMLCWAIHREAALPMDRLCVQFYSAPYELMKAHKRERNGTLTFEIDEFINLLEQAEVFRALLKPDEQQHLHELLALPDSSSAQQFGWGRLLGSMSQEARDMLASWRIRQWPKARVQLLYELLDYVALPHFH